MPLSARSRIRLTQSEKNEGVCLACRVIKSSRLIYFLQPIEGILFQDDVIRLANMVECNSDQQLGLPKVRSGRTCFGSCGEDGVFGVLCPCDMRRCRVARE
jgi:hypothetical protein